VHPPDGTGRGVVGANEPYLTAVFAAGGLPVVLLPVDAPEAIAATLDAVDGLVFTGGMDVDPRHYGEAILNDTVKPEPERDAFELPLLRGALARDLPVLAICRGCQVLNVAAGGSLWQDLPAQRSGHPGHPGHPAHPAHPAEPGEPLAVAHRQLAARDAVTHAVRVAGGSLLAGVIGGATTVDTNTFHHQAARTVADGLVAVAHATDGTIEGLESPHHAFVLGVQWHPEHLAATRPEHARLFRALVAAAAGAAGSVGATTPGRTRGAVPDHLRQTA